MDIVLRLLSVAGVFVSFGEGVCDVEDRVSLRSNLKLPRFPPTTGSRGSTANDVSSSRSDAELQHRQILVNEGFTSSSVLSGREQQTETSGVCRRGLTEGLEVFDGHKPAFS
jgi:hypothetical protein